MAGVGSVVVRRQLGSKLRRLRLAAGKDVADVTEAGLGSKAKISRIETGKGPVKVADIRALCWLYGADLATTEALAAMSPGTRDGDWWESFGPASVPDWYRLYVGLEAEASRIRSFEAELVPGLLQTPDYARAVFRIGPPQPEEVIEQRVRFRMERKRTQADLYMIIGEAALRREAGSPEIMAAQIEQVRSAAAEVRVLPFSAGIYPLRGSYALLDFDHDDEAPSVAYVEGTWGGRYYDTPEERAEYERVWEFVLSRSIPMKEWT